MNRRQSRDPSSFILPPSSFRRLALLLEYDGSAYSGSQRQENAPSIQAALEEAIGRLSGQAVRTAFAGRTDAGVHARGQVAAFDTEAEHSLGVWQRGLNALLPRDIAVRSAALVEAGFDPRRDAQSREYVYTIWNRPVRSPLFARMSWHVSQPLEKSRMAQALTSLIGEHDFAAFGGSPGPGRSTRRRIYRADLRCSGKQVMLTIEGNAFLPHQVRRTVGALVEIGRGRLAPDRFERWLVRPEPGIAGPTAPPHGLCLLRVSYQGRGPLFGTDD